MSSKQLMVVKLIGCAHLLIAIAVGANPWPSAFALLILVSFQIADKYFHDSFHDENKFAISQLKESVSKLKAKQDAADLRGAFGGKG